MLTSVLGAHSVEVSVFAKERNEITDDRELSEFDGCASSRIDELSPFAEETV
jgi:hypothetical protein